MSGTPNTPVTINACQVLLTAAKSAKKDFLERQRLHDALIEQMVAEVRKTNPALADEYLATAERLANDEETILMVGNLFQSAE